MRLDIVFAMIMGTSVLTFCIRYLPLVLLRQFRLPRKTERFLKSLPIGILAALVAQSIFLRGGALDSGLSNYYFYGFLVVLAVSTLTRSLAAVVFGGLGVVALLTFLGSR